MNETHKTIFKSHQIELISFGIIHLFLFLFCLEFLCFYCHFSLFRKWLFFRYFQKESRKTFYLLCDNKKVKICVFNNTNKTWKKLEECRNFEKIIEKNILHTSRFFYRFFYILPHILQTSILFLFLLHKIGKFV